MPLLIALLVIKRRQVEVMALFCQTSITNNSLQLGEVCHVSSSARKTSFHMLQLGTFYFFNLARLEGSIHSVITQGGGSGLLSGLVFCQKGGGGQKLLFLV